MVFLTHKISDEPQNSKSQLVIHISDNGTISEEYTYSELDYYGDFSGTTIRK